MSGNETRLRTPDDLKEMFRVTTPGVWIPLEQLRNDCGVGREEPGMEKSSWLKSSIKKLSDFYRQGTAAAAG